MIKCARGNDYYANSMTTMHNTEMTTMLILWLFTAKNNVNTVTSTGVTNKTWATMIPAITESHKPVSSEGLFTRQCMDHLFNHTENS